MPNEKTPQELTPGAPVLLYPQEEAVIDGRNLRFVWQPVEDATAYFLEIATDPSFETVVYEKNVGDATNIKLEEAVPADGKTYFWRVFAGNEHGWSEGENIESFLAGTEDILEQGELGSPDIDEEYGPAAMLFRGAAAEVVADVTGSDAAIREEQELGVAHEGVEAGQIIGFVLAVVVALIIIIVLAFTYASVVAQEARRSAAGGFSYELQQVDEAARGQITTYEIIDQEAGRYRIPVDRAMELMAQEAEGEQDQAGSR